MRATPCLLALLFSCNALAQRDVLFGDGRPPIFKEEELDRRFAKSRIGRALTHGTSDPACVQLLGGLLTALAEVAPSLHKRDENFTLPPALLASVGAQLTSPRFPGAAYLASMVRRVLIDKKLPEAWLETAVQLNRDVRTIDVGKLRFLSDGLRPIDSFYFTLASFKERYDIEVLRANSAATSPNEDFKDAYLDRDVAWGGLTFVDARYSKARVSPARGKKRTPAPEPSFLVAQMTWEAPAPKSENPLLSYIEPEKGPQIRVTARLAPKQFLDVSKLPRGKRVLARGRFWELSDGANRVELRDALLFEDRDWSRGALLASPDAVVRCPLALNELTGTAPSQPGGFAH